MFFFSKVIGKLTAAELCVQNAPLFIKPLERIKETGLKIHAGNFDSFMKVPRTIDTTLQ